MIFKNIYIANFKPCMKYQKKQTVTSTHKIQLHIMPANVECEIKYKQNSKCVDTRLHYF